MKPFLGIKLIFSLVLVLACASGPNEELEATFERKPIQVPNATHARSPESVRNIFENSKEEVFAIYLRWLEKYPNLGGTFRFEAIIQPNGRISPVRVIKSTFGHTDLNKQLLDVVEKIEFKPGEQFTPIKIEYTYSFFPN